MSEENRENKVQEPLFAPDRFKDKTNAAQGIPPAIIVCQVVDIGAVAAALQTAGIVCDISRDIGERPCIDFDGALRMLAIEQRSP